MCVRGCVWGGRAIRDVEELGESEIREKHSRYCNFGEAGKFVLPW